VGWGGPLQQADQSPLPDFDRFAVEVDSGAPINEMSSNKF
jgi:hypothetical protein